MSTPESQFDFSTVARPAPPPSPAPAYDFSTVAREAPATHKPRPAAVVASSPPAPVASTWSLAAGAPKVKDWYKQNFNADLPVTSFGQDAYHDSLNLDHRNSFDVPLSPSSKEGQALVSYLTAEGIPFRPITKADIARGVKASGEHIHVGPESHRLGAQPAYDFSSVARDAPLDFSSVAQAAPDDDVISINARKPDAPAPPAPRTLSPLPERTSFNAQTEEGRQGRDARDLKEWGSNAKLSLDVPLPSGAQDWSQVSSEDASRQAARTFAASRGIPADFVEKWLDKNSHLNLHLYDSKTGEKKEPSDYVYEGSPAYDFERRTLRVSSEMPHLKQLEQDYQQSRGVAGGLSDLVTDDTYSPVEKLKAVTWDSPQGRETRAGADYMRRALKAADAGGWAYALGQGGGGAAAQAALAASDVPTAFDNPAGDAWRAGVEVAAPYVGPVVAGASGSSTIGKVVGGAVEPQMRDAARTGQAVLGVTAQPLNIVPLGEVSELFRAGQLGRAAAEGGELSTRVAKLLRPLGLEAPEHAAEQSLDVVLRGADGRHFLVNSGTDDVVDLSTGELVEMPGEPHYSTRQPRDETGKFDGPPQPSEWSIRTKAIIEGENPDEALAQARAAGVLPPLPPPARRPVSMGDVVRAASDVINLPKSLKSAGALHGPLRQSAPIAWAHPEFIASAYGNAARAYASGSAYREIAEELAARSWFKPMNDAGLYMPSVADVTLGDAVPFGAREERFASRLADRLPGVRQVVRPSERAYLTAQDSMRGQAVENFLRNNFAGPDGDLSAVDFSKIDPRTLRAAARDINILSGRGVVPIVDRFAAGRKIVAALNNPLWSPRTMAARLNALSPYRFVMNMENPATRPVAYQQAATAMRALSTLGVTAGLVSLIPGVKFQLNPYKPAFGKLSVGDTHYDLLDGIPSTAVFAAKMAKAFYLNAEGETPKKGQDVYSLAADFFRRRESPTGKVVHDAIAGRDVNGEPFTLGGAARELFLPFVIDGMYEGWKDSGAWGAVKALPGVIGVPSSTYKLKDKKGGGRSSEPAAPADTDANYMRLEGEPVSGNVEDRRDSGDDSAHYTAEDHRALVEERTAKGEPEIDDAQAGSIALLVDSIPEHAFSDFARSVDETKETGRAGEVVTRGAELAAKGLGYELPAQAHRAQRMLAREMRLRPVQFYFDAAAGRYGERMRSEALEGVYYPQNHLPR